MADAIARIVSEIQFLCRMHHHDVNPTLAAFIARAVVLENATQFPLDKELNEKDVKDLIKLSTERLLESDSPSLETVKMQVGFDTARVEETATLDLARAEREQRESALVREICATRLKPGNDVEALTSLYRKIFNFLVLRAGLDAGGNRPAEREIAAALESVRLSRQHAAATLPSPTPPPVTLRPLPRPRPPRPKLPPRPRAGLPAGGPEGIHRAAPRRQDCAAPRALQHRLRDPPVQPAHRQGRRRNFRPADHVR
jgi:hypothetical protein